MTPTSVDGEQQISISGGVNPSSVDGEQQISISGGVNPSSDIASGILELWYCQK
jgi:hypothetical protein